MKMLTLTDRVCGSELLTTRSPLGRTVFWNTRCAKKCTGPFLSEPFLHVYGAPRDQVRLRHEPRPGALHRAPPVGMQHVALIGAHPRLVRLRGSPAVGKV